MKRECSFLKKFYEHKDFSCDDEEHLCCDQINCLCACSQVENLFKFARDEYLKEKNHYFLTIYDEEGIKPISELRSFDIYASKKRILAKLRKIRIPGFRAFGALDIEQQDFIDKDRSRKSRWLPHWHFLVSSDLQEKQLKRLIYRAFNLGTGKRVALLKVVSEKPFSCEYLVKRTHQFKRRLSSSSRGQRQIQLPIKGKAKRELQAFLQLNSRLEWIGLVGFRRYGNRIVVI